jgi:uncharacterized protein YciI
MTYLILGYDGDDDGAPARRAAVREAHLAGIRPLVDDGRLVIGGAILDADGAMRGSMMVLEAASEEDARRIVESDVYVREGVWTRWEIHPFKRAV